MSWCWLRRQFRKTSLVSLKWYLLNRIAKRGRWQGGLDGEERKYVYGFISRVNKCKFLWRASALRPSRRVRQERDEGPVFWIPHSHHPGPDPGDRTEDHPEANEAVGSIELNLGVGRKGWAKPAPSQLLLSPGSQDEDLASGSQHCLNTGELMKRPVPGCPSPQVLISLEWDSDSRYFSTLPEDFNVQIGCEKLT